MEWPERSFDLNPIQRVWDVIGRCLKLRNPPTIKLSVPKSALIEEKEGE